MDRRARSWLEEREQRQRREWRFRLALSVVGHLAVAGLFLVAPARARMPMPSVVRVDLVAAIPRAAAPRRAAPKPAAAQPVPSARPLPKPKAKPARKLLPKRAPRAKPRPQPERPRPARPEELGYDDALEALRQQLGEQKVTPDFAAEAPGESGVTDDEATGSAVSPELASWLMRAQSHVARHWVDPPEFRNRGLETVLDLMVLGDGSLVGRPQVLRSSGNPYADDNAIRALLGSSPLPAPPRAGNVTFIFRPEDNP